MLTDDKKISTPEYWDNFYAGKNDTPVDNSNTVRTITFDRFDWVVNQIVPGFDLAILDVGSGHARIPERIRARWPHMYVMASDQSEEARKISKYRPYITCTAYAVPFKDKFFDVVICTQAMEYMEDNDLFLREAKRVAKKVIITVPSNDMKKWSQLRIYTEASLKELVQQHGTIEHFEQHEDLFLVKVKFFE